jgi:hypothetical protein
MRAFYGVFVLAAFLSLPLAAGPIEYIESGQLSGTLGSTVLTNAAFSFTFFGDTANITGTNPILNPALSNVITIAGSPGAFTTAVEVGDSNAASVVGFSDLSLNNGITLVNAAAATYNLATAIGPLTAVTEFDLNASTLGTTLGTLTITSATNLSFQAVPTPEPATVGLAALALLGMAVAGRRKLF